MDKYIGYMNERELKDFIIELQIKNQELEKQNNAIKQVHKYDLAMIDEVKGNYVKLSKENQELKKQIEEYQKALDDTMSEKMDLEEENKKYKEVIDKVSSKIKLYGKYNGEKCTRGFSMMTADFNKLLDSLKEVD